MQLPDVRRLGVCNGQPRLVNARVIETLSEAEPYWRALCANDAVATPYQNFAFLAAWHREVGTRQRMTPFIVVGLDAHARPLCLLPLGLARVGPLRQVGFLGGKHANFNIGLWNRDLAASVDAHELDVLLHGIAESPHRPDVLTLYGQPRQWEGLANPLLRLPHRPSTSNGACLVIDGPGQEVIERALGGATRGRLRTKERKLQKLAGYRYFQAKEAPEVDRLLDRFLDLKKAHMAAQGLPNVFADEGVAAFLRAACHAGLSEGRPSLELHALEGDGELLAVFGAVTDDRSMSVTVNTYTLSDHARHSPGLIIILHLIQACADRGIVTFDLGAGDAAYKSWFCKQPIELFDSFLPFTALGRLCAMGIDMARTAKREIKSSPVLWNAYCGLRRALGGFGGESRRV